MTGREIYEVYAKEDSIWSAWVRPVPFVAIDTYKREPEIFFKEINQIAIKEYDEKAAIFVDLPGDESVEMGISLAKMGYIPIPIYNGVDEQEDSVPVVNTNLVESALINGASILRNIKLEASANPAFLMDSNRLNRYRKYESIFDNSWDVYGQDVPSGEFFTNHNINKIIVIGDKINRDLRKIFFKYKDIEFYLTDGYMAPKKVVLKKTLKEKLEKEEL